MSSHLNIPRSASAVESSLVINHILEAGVRKAPDQTITYGDRTFTYRDLDERVRVGEEVIVITAAFVMIPPCLRSVTFCRRN